VVESDSIKIGGDAFNDAIIRYIRRKHSVLIGENTAEELKLSIGCVYPKPETATVDVKGRCLMTGLPRMVTISTTEMLEAFEEVSERILETIHHILEITPPELVADISRNGIVLTGGGSTLWGFDKLIESRTSIKTHIADDASMCVAFGLAKSLEKLDDMREGTINISRRKQMK
jgi:rod shape-determining protein MreB